MIELPGWNDLISVNGFCYSSSMGESPKLNIPLKTSTAPTKGIAPATFARNSTATYIDANGVLQTAGIDATRFQNGRYLVEPAATNLSPYSQSMVSWSLSLCTITPNADVAPDGTLTADKATITGQYTHVHQLISGLTAGATYTLSLWLKNIDFNETIALYVSNSSSTVSYLNSTITITDEWTRYSGSFTVPSDITTVRIRALRTISETFGGSLLIWGVQVETGTKATSYIPTTTAPMDRVADVLHYAVGDVITQGQGSLYCEFNYTGGTGVVRKVINLSNGTIAERITLYINTINGLQVIGVTGGVTTIDTPTVTYAVSGNNKILLTYRDNSVVAYHNGSLAGSDFSGLISRIFTKIHVGVGQDGLSQLNNEIGNIKYLKEVLTEAEAIKLTTR